MKNFLLFALFTLPSFFANSQELTTIGKATQIQLKLSNQKADKCNIDVLLPGGGSLQRDLSKPDYETTIEFTPTTEGIANIKWEGKTKIRGFSSVTGCEGQGQITVKVIPFVTQSITSSVGATEDSILKSYSDKKGDANSFAAIFFPKSKPSSALKSCTFTKTIDNAYPLLGFRNVKGVETFGFKRANTIDLVGDSFDKLFEATISNTCDIAFLTVEDASNLVDLLKQKKFKFIPTGVFDRDFLVSSYADSVGLKTADQLNFLKQIPGEKSGQLVLALEKFSVKDMDSYNAALQRMSTIKYSTDPSRTSLIHFLEDEQTGKALLEKFGIKDLDGFKIAVQRMNKIKYSADDSFPTLALFLQDEQDAKNSKKSPLIVKAEREKKQLAEQKAQELAIKKAEQDRALAIQKAEQDKIMDQQRVEEAERQKRLAYARENPYEAILSCEVNGRNMRQLIACFSASASNGGDTELEIQNGTSSQTYKAYTLRSLGREQEDGLHVTLKKNFYIHGQNASDYAILRLIIKDNATGNILLNQTAGHWKPIQAQ